MFILQILLTSCNSYGVIKTHHPPVLLGTHQRNHKIRLSAESLPGSAAVWDLGQTLLCHLFSKILLFQYFVLVFLYPTPLLCLTRFIYPSYVSLQEQNPFTILQFCFVCLLHLHQNQISSCFSLHGIFLLDEVTAQLIQLSNFFLIVQLLLFSTIIFPIHSSLEIVLNLSESSEEQTEGSASTSSVLF